MRHAVAILLSLVCLWPSAGAAQGVPCPVFDIPSFVQAYWVAQDMKMNGMPMQIKEFHTKAPPEQVLAFYRAVWGKAPPYYYEYQNAGWQVIATMKNRCFFTTQVKSDGAGGADGLLGVSTRPANNETPVPGKGFPVMPGSTVLNDMDSYDGGKTGRTLVLLGHQSVENTASYYIGALGDQGWVVLNRRTVSAATGNDGQVVVLKRGHAEADLAISASTKGTTVLATLVDNP